MSVFVFFFFLLHKLTHEGIVSPEEIPENFVCVAMECVALSPGAALCAAGRNSILQALLTKLVINRSLAS